MTDAPELDLIPEEDNGDSKAELPTQQWTPESEPSPPRFEDLTLAQAVGALLRMPQQTIENLIAVASARQERPAAPLMPETHLQAGVSFAVTAAPQVLEADAQPTRQIGALSVELVQFGLYLSGIILAWIGTSTMASGGTSRGEQVELATGIPFVVLGFLSWIAGELVGQPPKWLLRGMQREEDFYPRDTAEDLTAKPPSAPSKEKSEPGVFSMAFARTLPIRAFGVGLGAICSVLALTGNANNLFTTAGVAAWFASIGFWVVAIAPVSWYEAFVSGAWLRGIDQRLRGRRRGNGTLIALLAIVALGAYFRLYRLDQVPPEMTSDHVEKILDSARVLDGVTQVFFPNNGGREPVQMYLMAMLSQVPGLGMNFTTLKLLSAIEGILTLPILWWFGREIVGREQRELGNVVGLCLAGLVAVSGWHEVLSRMGLRIVLTVLVTALLLTYLARGLRNNQRGDFIKAGLVLGFGLYAYQAVRMLPVVVLVGVGFALIAAKGWQARGRYMVNLAVLVLMAFIVFVPLFGFSLQSPDDFWRRTAGRILGDAVIETTDENGNIVQIQVPLEERIAAFQQNLPVLLDNLRNGLLMFNWKGDVAWISNFPNAPHMDALTGALLIVGLAAWLARMWRRRDAADWLMPATLFIMVLPSALSIAYTIENPSATRTSGTIPTAYLLAALPLAVLALSSKRLLPAKLARVMLVLVPATAFGVAYTTNATQFFELYRVSYEISSLPYSDAGRVLRGFAESDGGYGNAFMVGYAYWWDHRALGIEAGRTDWHNGIDTALVSIPDAIREAYECRSGQDQLNPERDLLFFLSPDDTDTQTQLQTWFPTGYGSIYATSQFGDTYYLFRVPRLGFQTLELFINTYSTAPRC